MASVMRSAKASARAQAGLLKDWAIVAMHIDLHSDIYKDDRKLLEGVLFKVRTSRQSLAPPTLPEIFGNLQSHQSSRSCIICCRHILPFVKFT